MDRVHVVFLLKQEDHVPIEAHPPPLPLHADPLGVADHGALEVRMWAAEGPQEQGRVLGGPKVDLVHVHEALRLGYPLSVDVGPEGADVVQVEVRGVGVDDARHNLGVVSGDRLVCLGDVDVRLYVPSNAHLFAAVGKWVLCHGPV